MFFSLGGLTLPIQPITSRMKKREKNHPPETGQCGFSSWALSSLRSSFLTT